MSTLFLKLFLLFSSLRYTHSPYGIRTRVTAVKRRCLNPLTNGPELFNSFYYTYFFLFVKNFLISYTNFSMIIEKSQFNRLSLFCLPISRTFLSPPVRNQLGNFDCFSYFVVHHELCFFIFSIQF